MFFIMSTVEVVGSRLGSPEDRRRRAIAGARAAVDMMKEKGVSALVIGSLAKGHFGAHSDVDFLLTSCPREYKYAIEAKVEDIMGDLPFDVVYLEEIPKDRMERFISGAVDAYALR
jgi:predicted nucleotidyltransferase